MIDRITKQKFNIFILVDNSTSMRGARIEQVNNAIASIAQYLNDLQYENANMDFYISILVFGTTAKWYEDIKSKNINEFVFQPIKAGGQSNLCLAYKELNIALEKESKGGIMPDFGGVAPIILLLSDGHPTKGSDKEELAKLKTKVWFNVALKYGIAIELNDDRTIKVLNNFVCGNGQVIEAYDASILEKLIKIIVVTASKIKSSSSSVTNVFEQPIAEQILQEINDSINDIDNWEW